MEFGAARARWGGGEFGHGFELHVTVLELPLVVLLHEDGADQADDAWLIGEDAHNVGPTLYLLVQAFQWIGAVQLGPVLAGKAI